MKGRRKLSAVLLMILLCVWMLRVPVYAATDSQNGLEVTLMPGKMEYHQKETICVTVTVENKNDFAVKNISLETYVPEGYRIAKDNETVTDIKVLHAGEKVTVTVQFVAKETMQDGGSVKPPSFGNGQNHEHTGGDNGGSQTAKPSVQGTNSLKTGDESNVILWGSLFVVAFGFIVIMVTVKKKGKRLLSVLLCITIAGTGITWSDLQVNAAKHQRKTFSVEEVIKVNGKEVPLKAVVSYEFAEDETTEEIKEYTRGEWIELLVHAYGYPTDRTETEDFGYIDISESDYQTAIETAIVYNILEPKEGEAFHPDGIATREFAADTAVKSMGYTETEALDCMDKDEIENPKSAKIAVEIGLFSLEEHYFYPDRPLSQKEAKDILKFLEKEYGSLNPGEEGSDSGIKFLDSVIQKEGPFDWIHDGNTAVLPEKEPKPEVGQIYTFGYETVIKVETVEEEQGQIKITYSKPEFYEFIDEMDMEGQATMDFSKFVPAEGVTVTNLSANDIQTFGFADDAFDVPAGGISSNFNTELSGSVEIKDGWEIGYSLGLKVPSVNYKFDIDFDANPFNDTPAVNVKNAYLKIKNDANLHVDFGKGVDTGDDSFDDSAFDDVFEKEIELGSVPLVGINGMCVEVEVDLVLKAEGKFEVDYNIHGTTGVQIINNRLRNISALQSSLSCGLQGNVSAGDKIGVEAELFGEDILDVALEAGARASGSVHARSTGLVCMDAAVFAYAELQALDHCLIDDWLNIGVTWEIWDANNSPFKLCGHWENLKKVDACTYDGAGLIKGTVANAENRTTYIQGATIEVMDNDAFKHETTVYTDDKGAYVAKVPGGTHLVRISADGYIPFESLETVGEQQEIYVETYLLVEGSANSNEKGTIRGCITNAVNGAGVENAKLTIRKGWNRISGEVVATIESDATGNYSTTLPIGNYTVLMEKQGYISNHINVAVTKNGVNQYNGVLTPDGSGSIELGDMRIILTWTNEPSDLDSHLWGPKVDGDSRYHIYYRNMSYYHNGERQSFLDLDDTYYEGPETTTIYNMQPNGTYQFYVHDFTNAGKNTSTVLANSGAKVQVYMGKRLIQQFVVPTSGTGDVWHVFDFDAKTGKIKPMNTFSTVGSANDVGNPYAVMNFSLEDAEQPINPPKAQP